MPPASEPSPISKKAAAGSNSTAASPAPTLPRRPAAAERAPGCSGPHDRLSQSPMKLLSILVLALPLCAQVPLPDLPDETVVATFDDGVRMTMGDFKRLFAVIPVENQQQALQNRPAFLKQWAHMRKLAKVAEADGLDKLSPSKDAIEYYRVLILSQAKANAALTQVTVLPSDVRADYETNKDRYKQVRVKAIYIGFDGKKLTQDGAQAKAAKLLAQLRAGADFGKLAKESSDDETSRTKNGEFATLSRADNIP